MNLKEYIASVPNYPKEGIIFRDISPLMANGKAYQYATQQIVDYARKIGAEMIVGPEARGFIPYISGNRKSAIYLYGFCSWHWYI